MTNGEKIKSLRKSLGLTQEEFAGRIFVSRRAVIDWEGDKYSPQAENIKSICKEFNLSLDYFLSDTDTNLDNKDEAKSSNENLRNSLFLADKHELYNNLKEFSKRNNIKWYYDYGLMIGLPISITIIIISFFIKIYPWGITLLPLGIILLIATMLINKYIKNRFLLKLVSLRLEALKDLGNLISPLHNLYYLDDDNRLIIKNIDNEIVNVDKSSIKDLNLGINRNAIRGILPDNLPKLIALFSINIYYKDGNISRLILGAYDTRLTKDVMGINNAITVEALNKLKIKYSNTL